VSCVSGVASLSGLSVLLVAPSVFSDVYLAHDGCNGYRIYDILHGKATDLVFSQFRTYMLWK